MHEGLEEGRRGGRGANRLPDGPGFGSGIDVVVDVGPQGLGILRVGIFERNSEYNTMMGRSVTSYSRYYCERSWGISRLAGIVIEGITQRGVLIPQVPLDYVLRLRFEDFGIKHILVQATSGFAEDNCTEVLVL